MRKIHKALLGEYLLSLFMIVLKKSSIPLTYDVYLHVKRREVTNSDHEKAIALTTIYGRIH